MQLRDLEIGDIFTHARIKALPGNREFRVEENPTYVNGKGRQLRKCVDLTNNTEVYKDCWIQVTKTRESNRKQQMLIKP